MSDECDATNAIFQDSSPTDTFWDQQPFIIQHVTVISKGIFQDSSPTHTFVTAFNPCDSHFKRNFPGLGATPHTIFQDSTYFPGFDWVIMSSPPTVRNCLDFPRICRPNSVCNIKIPGFAISRIGIISSRIRRAQIRETFPGLVPIL